MTEQINCSYCGKDFLGNKSSKYCGEVCKGLAKVERDTGYRVEPQAELKEVEYCDGLCERLARRFLKKRPRGWEFLTVRTYEQKRGERIKYCPYCGRELN